MMGKHIHNFCLATPVLHSIGLFLCFHYSAFLRPFLMGTDDAGGGFDAAAGVVVAMTAGDGVVPGGA